MSKPRDALYWVWSAMIQRCHNPRNKQYKDYGGRGIYVCDRWRDYKNFLADMGHSPPGRSLDRINNNKGYQPDNCRWATRIEQAGNKRNCIYVVRAQGRRMALAEYCRIYRLPYRPIVKRIQDYGWPIEMAVSVPVGSGPKHFTAEAISLWAAVEELRDYLRVALRAAEGYPVSEQILDSARILADQTPTVSAA